MQAPTNAPEQESKGLRQKTSLADELLNPDPCVS